MLAPCQYLSIMSCDRCLIHSTSASQPRTSVTKKSGSSFQTTRHNATQHPTLVQHSTSQSWALSYYLISSLAGISTRPSCLRRRDLLLSASAATGTLIACDKMKSSTVSSSHAQYTIPPHRRSIAFLPGNFLKSKAHPGYF